MLHASNIGILGISVICLMALLPVSAVHAENAESAPAWMMQSTTKLESELVAQYGEAQRSRLQRGLQQMSEFWRTEDGDAAAFEEFARANFAGDQATLDTMFDRFELLLEKLDGHMYEITRELRNQTDLDRGRVYPFDEIFAAYDPSAHVGDDFFANKLAFTVLLNFPMTTLEQRLAEGGKWTRRQWAEARLVERFAKRIPAEAVQAVGTASAEAEQYIADYNIWMHHLVDAKGVRLFPPKLRLLTHWNLRDELKADYGDPQTGLAKQRLIQQVMERIVTQTIPEVVINNPNVDWNPITNDVKPAAVKDSELPAPAGMVVTNGPEPDTRYVRLKADFIAETKIDPYSPTAPTLMAQRFDEDRQIPEVRVTAMLEQIVFSPDAAQIGKIIQKRLGRPLEPFDIWYTGFRPRGAYTEAQLDEIVSKKYPTVDAYQKDIPNLLMKLGFTKERAEYLADHIIVDPARGSGHAAGASMRPEKAHLRTRVEQTGMNYKGFNIAVHEMGHNVEQVFSLNNVDHWLIEGVPNTAFTEAFAFVFQARDLELLGLSASDAKSDVLTALGNYWTVYEISGVALVDMAVWHWMYDHPDATPAALKEATIRISKDVWNKYYAPVFGKKDVVILGIYSHMVNAFLYLPDYAIGHLISMQIEAQMKKAGNVGAEFERMATEGRVAPDIWMTHATGSVVNADALLDATRKALAEMGAEKPKN